MQQTCGGQATKEASIQLDTACVTRGRAGRDVTVTVIYSTRDEDERLGHLRLLWNATVYYGTSCYIISNCIVQCNYYTMFKNSIVQYSPLNSALDFSSRSPINPKP